MHEQSGLFAFIMQSIEDNSIIKLPMGGGFKLIRVNQYPAYLLFAPERNLENNPFEDLGFVVGDPGHIRVDSVYSKSLDNRTIAYCHGTEYFVNPATHVKIVVRYYFDQWGHLTQVTCKINEEPMTNHLQQMKLLYERATVYGNAISTLVQKKQQAFMAVTEELEESTQAIIKMLKEPETPLTLIEEMLEHRKELSEKKSQLSDNEDTEIDQFSNLLMKLIAEKQNPKAKSTTADDDTDEEEHDTEGESNTVAQQVQTQCKKSLPKKPANNQTAELAKRLRALVKDSNSLSTHTTSEALGKYLKELTELRVEVLCLTTRNNLFKELDKVKTEIELFQAAIQEAHLEHVKILLPFCGSQIKVQIYFKALHTCLVETYDNRTKGNRKIPVMDFLHENCSIFKSAIRLLSSMPFESNGTYYSILYHAYKSCSHELFSALLRYGMNPNTYWVVYQDGVYEMPIQIIVSEPVNTRFYIDELVKYGLKLQGNIIYVHDADLPKYRDMINPSEYKILIANSKKARAKGHKYTFPTNLRNKSDGSIIKCPLINFAYQNEQKYNDADQLFAALVDHSELESLLIVLPQAAEGPYITQAWLPHSLKSCLAAVDGLAYKQKYKELYGIEMTGTHNHLSLLYRTDGDGVDQTRTTLLVKKINTRLSSLTPAEIERIEYKLKGYLAMLSSKHLKPFTAEIYLGLNILSIAKGSLNKTQQAEVVHNFAESAFASIERGEGLCRMLEMELRSSLTRGVRLEDDRLNKFKLGIGIEYSMAITNLWRGVQVAYLNSFPEISKLPCVERCFQEAKKILADKRKLPAEVYDRWKSEFRFREQMEQVKVQVEFSRLVLR